MNSELIIEGPVDPPLAARACERILRALPDWFGLEDAVLEYIHSAGALPTWLALIHGEAAGFLTIKPHFPTAAEVYVMGVLPAYQGRGAGRGLLTAAECFLRGQGTRYLQVKTLSATIPDPFYARTRAFYLAAGFQPLEEFPLLWGKQNPCLQMVKVL